MVRDSGNNSSPLVAVLDIGKTSAKLLVVDAHNGEVVWSTARPCRSIVGESLLQLDIQGIEQWLLESLAEIPDRVRIEAIVPITHGAAAVLLDSAGAPLIAPDYEDLKFDSIADEYRMHRDPFAATFSPELGQGLNLGRQLYYLQQRLSDLFARCHSIVLYPQYWAYRLSGALASEVTSLGCHTDLWDVGAADYSTFAEQMDWPLRFPLLRKASDSLGMLRPEVAAKTGLDGRCRVICGIHDSNASYLCHLIDRTPDEPFAAISSGTWTVVMGRGLNLERLRPDYDMLVNVDAFGSSVGTARFMGGREYAAIAGVDNTASPTLDGLRFVLARNAQALPSFAESGGPFAMVPGRLVRAEQFDDSQRASLATLYVALMSDLLLELLDVNGDIAIDGPLAMNPLYGSILATLRRGNPVKTIARYAGPSTAGVYLAGFRPPASPSRFITPLSMPELQLYRTAWRAALPFNPLPADKNPAHHHSV